jgi:hypothetical protein
MSQYDHASSCLELTLIATIRAHRASITAQPDDPDQSEPLVEYGDLAVDEAMTLFEHTTLAALEFATALGLTDAN